MRSNYQEVDEATALCLEATAEGQRYCDFRCEKGESELPNVDTLLAVEDEYFTVTSGASLKTWWEEFKKQYLTVYDTDSLITFKQWCEMWTSGQLSIRKVIWDD